MAAVSPQSMLAEEIRLQCAAACTWNASVLKLAEHPSDRALVTHDVLIVEFGEVARDQADNESDFVSYVFNVIFATQANNAETGGRTLDDWVRASSLALGDRASDRSPLRTVPLPLSSLTLSGSVVFDVKIGSSTPGTMPGEGTQGFRLARTVEVTVVCFETRT